VTDKEAQPTLADSLRRHANQLNFLRLVLALLVLVSHAFPLGGYGSDPAWPLSGGATSIGGFAVGGFFALSGLLVTMSGTRRSAAGFIWSRFLRIYPAYFVVLVLVAFVVAPIFFFLTHGTLRDFPVVSLDGAFTYVVHNASFPIGLQFGIGDVFATTTPYGNQVGESVLNGSLWTLPLEVRCYVVALLLVLVGRLLGFTRSAFLFLLAAGLTCAVAAVRPDVADFYLPDFIPVGMIELLFVFLCGAVLGTLAHRIPVNWILFGSVAAVYVVASLAGGGWFRTVGLGSLAVLLPLLARALPAPMFGIFSNDLSYGTYVWAFPVQQSAAFFGWNNFPALYLVGSAVITLFLAGLSWRFVEKPALKLKRYAPGPSKDQSKPPVAMPAQNA
jgi:peptidoglycan/LPS O-acetylase OafA/YrhL